MNDVDSLNARLATILATPDLRLVPIRHHSPTACARHLVVHLLSWRPAGQDRIPPDTGNHIAVVEIAIEQKAQ